MTLALITGANGFVGSHLCEAFLASDYQVRALVRPSSDLSNIEGIDLELLYGDLNDPESLRDAVEGVDIIINNAGLTKTIDPVMFDTVNIAGTGNLLEAAKDYSKISRFIQISSMAASGPASSYRPLTEDHPPRPLTAYGRSKLGGEKAVLNFKDQFPVTILRPSAVYGPRDKEMLAFFKAVKFKLKPTFGSGECYINFTYVKDLARAVLAAVRTDTVSGNVYFIAEKKAYSYSQAGDIISEVMGVRALDIHLPVPVLKLAGLLSEWIAGKRGQAVIFTEDKAAELSAKYWLVDTSAIEKDTGFVPRYSFKAGAAETIEWYSRRGWL